MLTDDQKQTDGADGNLDPNLQLQQQRQVASDSGVSTIPMPPPLPTPTPNSPSGTSTTEQAKALAAQPTNLQPNDATPSTVPNAPTISAIPTPPPLSDATPMQSGAMPVLMDAPPAGYDTVQTPATTSTTSSKLPTGFTMGDPLSSNYGTAYYNGSRIIGKIGDASSPTGYYYETEDGQYAPYTADTEKEITGAGNAAYGGYKAQFIPSTADDFANGVEAYGHVWKAGTAPPPGLSDAQLQDWQRAHMDNVGYAKSVWDTLSSTREASAVQDKYMKMMQAGQQLTPEQQAEFNDASNTMNSSWAPFANHTAQTAQPILPYNQPAGPARYLQNGLETDAQGNPIAGGYNALLDAYRQLGTTPGTANPIIANLIKQNPALINTLPPDQAKTLTATLASMGINLPATSSRTPISMGLPTGAGGSTVLPAAPGFGAAGPTLGASVPFNPNASGTPAGGNAGPFNSSNVAIGSTVLPNADPRLTQLRSLLDSSASSLANVDRQKMAQDYFDQFVTSTDPQYQAAIRSATKAAAGAGRIGSGDLRTTYGDLALNRTQQLDNARKGFLTDALNGSIADQFNKVSALSGLEGSAYGENANDRNELRTERGYQGSLEQQAFDRALQQYLLDQQAKQQQFNNGVTLTTLGNSSNPASYYAQIAAQLGMDPSAIMTLAKSLGQKAA